MTRPPAVAGYFYPAEVSQLRAEIKRCLSSAGPKKKAIGIVSPHAGYQYSGAVAGQVYGQIELPKKNVILSPNHTGEGLPYAIMPQGGWETPLGFSKIDEELSVKFMQNCPLLQKDFEAHRAEHSLEVQLPFLQYLRSDFTFVPVTFTFTSYDRCRQVGMALAKTIQETKEPVLIIASSDMNHYESGEVAQKKDFLAIDRIQALDPSGLYETVKKYGISMCGIIPTTIMLVAAKELGASRAELVCHATSGDVTGDQRSVVGYASLAVS